MQTLKMKLLLLVLVVYLSTASALVSGRYHETVGIPEATRIKQIESTRVHNTRISNGFVSILLQNPYFGGLVITLASQLTSICGSTLLTNTKLVTAAHCWNDGVNVATQFEVVLGSVTLFSGGTRLITNRVETHEAYNATTVRNDIALITIPHVTFSYYIKPINLPQNLSETFEGVFAKVVGFGRTSEWAGISASQQLSHTYVTVLNGDLCARLYGDYFTSTMVCTEGRYGGPCGGDSGGPLEDQNVLIGVISYGSAYGCQSGHPTVHTRVTSYVDWILARL